MSAMRSFLKIAQQPVARWAVAGGVAGSAAALWAATPAQADPSVLELLAKMNSKLAALESRAEAATAANAPKRRPIIGGNWKCNGDKASLSTLITEFNNKDLEKGIEVFIAPPTVYIDFTRQLLRKDFEVAIQDVHNNAKPGAYTGEIAPYMVKDIGLKYVVVGHSERRNGGGGSCGGACEAPEFIADKVKKVLEEGLSVVYCIGEEKDARVAGDQEKVCAAQMKTLLDAGIVAEWGERIVVAYEPVWAIGTGLTASPEQAQEMHAFLRNWIATNVSPSAAAATRIQYGGSAKAANAAKLAAQPDIDGLLIGGASLKGEFVDCCNAFKNKAC